MNYTFARPLRVSREQLEAHLRSPRARATVSRILNREAEEVKTIAQQLAEADLRRRPMHRRSRESLAYGREYHDCFEIVSAREMGLDKLRVAIRNTHPAARFVEHGTRPHRIVTRNPPAPLVFPFDGAAGKGSPGRPSGWLLEGPPVMFTRGVNHPGAGAFHILARALRTYRRRRNRDLGGGTAQI